MECNSDVSSSGNGNYVSNAEKTEQLPIVVSENSLVSDDQLAQVEQELAENKTRLLKTETKLTKSKNRIDQYSKNLGFSSTDNVEQESISCIKNLFDERNKYFKKYKELLNTVTSLTEKQKRLTEIMETEKKKSVLPKATTAVESTTKRNSTQQVAVLANDLQDNEDDVSTHLLHIDNSVINDTNNVTPVDDDANPPMKRKLKETATPSDEDAVCSSRKQPRLVVGGKEKVPEELLGSPVQPGLNICDSLNLLRDKSLKWLNFVHSKCGQDLEGDVMKMKQLLLNCIEKISTMKKLNIVLSEGFKEKEDKQHSAMYYAELLTNTARHKQEIVNYQNRLSALETEIFEQPSLKSKDMRTVEIEQLKNDMDIKNKNEEYIKAQFQEQKQNALLNFASLRISNAVKININKPLLSALRNEVVEDFAIYTNGKKYELFHDTDDFHTKRSAGDEIKSDIWKNKIRSIRNKHTKEKIDQLYMCLNCRQTIISAYVTKGRNAVYAHLDENRQGKCVKKNCIGMK